MFDKRKFITPLRLITMLGLLLIIVGIGSGTWLADGALQIGQPITINPTPIDTYLTNPGIGWQQMDDVPEGALPETVEYPDRPQIAWQILNPEEGVYLWEILDEKLNEAVADGEMFSFRVYTMRGEVFGGPQVPEWVLDKGANLIEGEPNYASCIYQEEWGRFVDALRERYDGNPDIAYIDVSGYGSFNEWNWNPQTYWEENLPQLETLDGFARKRLVDTFLGNSADDHECETPDGETVTVSYDYTGFQETQLIMPFAGIRQTLEYVEGLRSDVGFRYDCLGNPGDIDGLLERPGEVMANRWQDAPIVYEMCSEVDFDEANELLRFTHGSLVHDNATEDLEAVEDLLRYTGYRYLLHEATTVDAAAAGSSIPFDMTWRNVGYAPSYPRMGQTFTLNVYLTSPDGQIIVEQTTPADISTWMPADEIGVDTPPDYVVDTLLTIPEDTPDGAYFLEVAIIDQRSNQPINLGMEGATDTGRYVIIPILISD